ncbi:hypothetical protein HVPorG_04922 [Roseomonas mucosa]|nr:hypothetical protein HVPorG_04922 [Roseomonas mucosa]UZO92622.1 hypothetical protein RMP42_04922 [Roseomonas mucosa]UZO97458.1 hypothetical protein RMHFA_04922 [Roseomonas mucosa]
MKNDGKVDEKSPAAMQHQLLTTCPAAWVRLRARRLPRICQVEAAAANTGR